MNPKSLENLNSAQVEYVIEKKDLDLTKLEDLDFLVANASDLYNEILSYELAAESENFKSINSDIKIGHEIFTSVGLSLVDLKSIIYDVRTDVLNKNFNIDDSQIDTIQSLYNDLIQARNILAEAYAEVDKVSFLNDEFLSEEGIDIEADTYFFAATKDAPDSEMEFILDEKPKRGNLTVSDESLEGNIKIELKVAKGAETKIDKQVETKAEPKQMVVNQDLNPAENRVLLTEEKIDPVNKVIAEDLVAKATSDIKRYITDDSYAKILKEKENPVLKSESLQRLIDNAVKKIEDPSYDFFERKFDEYNSAFPYIENLTLTEIFALNQIENLREELKGETVNVKYDTLIAWIDFIGSHLLPYKEDYYDEDELTQEPTLKDFFARWVIENQ